MRGVSPEHLARVMTQEAGSDDRELRRLYSELDARACDIRDGADREQYQGELIARLRREATAHEHELAQLRQRLESAEDENEDLRAIRDALTPAELPQRPGLELAAAFLPAADRVSGDFYLAAEGPHDTTVLVVGDVVGHGLTAGGVPRSCERPSPRPHPSPTIPPAC